MQKHTHFCHEAMEKDEILLTAEFLALYAFCMYLESIQKIISFQWPMNSIFSPYHTLVASKD